MEIECGGSNAPLYSIINVLLILEYQYHISCLQMIGVYSSCKYCLRCGNKGDESIIEVERKKNYEFNKKEISASCFYVVFAYNLSIFYTAYTGSGCIENIKY